MSRMSTLASCVCVGLVCVLGTAGFAGTQAQHDCKPSGPHTSANPPCNKDAAKSSDTTLANKPPRAEKPVVVSEGDQSAPPSNTKTADKAADTKKTSTKAADKADKTSDSPKKTYSKTAEASEKNADKTERKPQ